MLVNNDATNVISFKVIEPAGKLYERAACSQEVRTEESADRTYKCGISPVRTGESKYAPGNRATSATWAVGDEIDAMLQSLQGF